jgi:cohesin complex subunit SA-1/2
MSESEATPTVRRSQRERRTAKPFEQGNSSRRPFHPLFALTVWTVSTSASKKRKRDTDDEARDATDMLTSDGGEVGEEPIEDDEEDYSISKTKTTKGKKQPTAGGTSKSRTKTSATKNTRLVKPKVATGGRKTKPDATVDVVQQIKDSHISDDNALFSMICFMLYCNDSF